MPQHTLNTLTLILHHAMYTGVTWTCSKRNTAGTGLAGLAGLAGLVGSARVVVGDRVGKGIVVKGKGMVVKARRVKARRVRTRHTSGGLHHRLPYCRALVLGNLVQETRDGALKLRGDLRRLHSPCPTQSGTHTAQKPC